MAACSIYVPKNFTQSQMCIFFINIKPARLPVVNEVRIIAYIIGCNMF